MILKMRLGKQKNCRKKATILCIEEQSGLYAFGTETY